MSAAGSLLESFFILFQSDAEDVEKGAKDAHESSDKLEKKLKDVDRQAKTSGESFASLAQKAAAVLLPFVGIAALKGAVVDFAASADAAGKLATTLNMDIEAMQAWQGAAERAGGTADGMTGSIKALNGHLYDIKRFGGGEAAWIFNRLGISIRDSEGKVKDANKMLLDLSDKMGGLSRERAIKIGEKLGLDEGTIELLRQGRKGVEDLLARQKELGLFTKRDAEESRKFNTTMMDTRQALGSVAQSVLIMLLPMLTAFNEGVTAIALSIRKHRDLVTGFFIGLGVILGVLAIKSLVAFAPFLLFAGVILLLAGAFAVLFDDVMNFLDGHDSVIGRLSKDYPWLGEMVKKIAATFKDLWTVVKAVGTLLMEAVENPAQAWENFTNKVGPLFDAFCKRFPELGQALKDLGTIFKWLFDLAWPIMKSLGKIVVDVIGALVKGISELFGWIGKALRWVAGKLSGEVQVITQGGKDDATRLPGELPPEVAADIMSAKAAVKQTDNDQLNSLPARIAESRQQNVTKTNTVTVERVEVITQAQDAEGISRDINGALERELQSAAENFDDGVRA